MIRFTDFRGELDRLLLTQLPTAYAEAIDQDVQEVVRNFYVESCTWRVKLGPFGRPGGDIHVLVSTPALTAINLVHDVAYNGCWLGLPRAGMAPWWGWGDDRPELLTLMPAPVVDEPKAVMVDASLLPEGLDAELPDSAVSHHLGALAAGCLARLYGQPSKPWYNLVEARTQRLEYRRGLAAAKLIGLRGYAPTPLQAYNPYGKFA